MLVKDIQPASNNLPPSILTNANGTLFFAADDGTYGRELWKSDGTSDGTVLVKDIFPGEISFDEQFSSDPSGMIYVNGSLFFTAFTWPDGRGLWRSDGTAGGTTLVKNILSEDIGISPLSGLVNVDGTIFFATDIDQQKNTWSLWKSDGTTEGTVIVNDMLPAHNYYQPQNFTNVDGTLFFTADDGTHGIELWKSDGTAEGTTLVKDINPGAGHSVPQRPLPFIDVNGTLFFRATDRTGSSLDLWKSDGTAEGTTFVSERIDSDNMIDVNGALFFTSYAGNIYSPQLWKYVDVSGAAPTEPQDDATSPLAERQDDGILTLDFIFHHGGPMEDLMVTIVDADGVEHTGITVADSQGIAGTVTFDGLPGDRVELTSVVHEDQMFSFWLQDQPSRQVKSLLFPLAPAEEREFVLPTTADAVLADSDDGIRVGEELPDSPADQPGDEDGTTESEEGDGAGADNGDPLSTPEQDFPSQALQNVLQPVDGVVGVVVYDLANNQTLYTQNEDRVFSAASLIKLPIAFTAYALADRGELSLDESLTITAEDIVGGTGSIQYEPVGSTYTTRELCARMLYDSDNTAANVVLERIGGFERVNSLLTDLGVTQTKAQRFLMDFEALQAGRDNLTSPADMARMLQLLAQDEIDGANELLAALTQTNDLQKIPALLPSDVVVSNKTGVLPSPNGVEHDAAVVTLPDERQYILVVMTDELSNNQVAIAAMAEASQIVYEHFQGDKQGTE